jgi:hypothetical protein
LLDTLSTLSANTLYKEKAGKIDEDSVCCSDKGIAMSSSESKIVVPAHAGFYVPFPAIEEKLEERVIRAYYKPVVAWEITSVDGAETVRPIAFGVGALDVKDYDYEVLCPNGIIVSDSRNWDNLKAWIFSKTRIFKEKEQV